MRLATTRRAERGQVLPLWIFGAMTTLALMFLAINYANNVRYQIRAQNAADSAAQAFIGIQSQRYNETNIAMLAANVEEYRLRKTLDGMLLAINATGGCTDVQNSPSPPFIDQTISSEGSCNRAYQDLKHEYLQSVNRYTTDLMLLNDATANNNLTTWNNDAVALSQQLSHASTACAGSSAAVSTANFGDCGMQYSIVGARARTTSLKVVQEDASTILVPALGNNSTLPQNVNPQLWAPAEVDLTTCIKVQPIIPNFGPIHLPTTYAVGRAAATNVMLEQDWMELGSLNDPQRGNTPAVAFQPFESYTQSSGVDGGGTASSTYDYYGVNFGGNTTYAFPTVGSFAPPTLNNDELSVITGWWNAIPEKPFAGTISTSTTGVCPP